jgi:hypothetical protein
MRTNLLAGATAFSLLLGFVTPVMALTSHEVEAVVGVVEQLAQEMGEGMVADAAGIFYDYDSLGAALIPEAGFSRESWITAYDAVTAGYMATIPQDEFDAVFEEPLATLEASELPEEQKAMLREHVAGLIAEAQALRQSGMQYADVVRPYEARLYPLFYGAFEE